MVDPPGGTDSSAGALLKPKKVKDMGAGNKTGNVGQSLWGKAKEAAGRLRGDRPQKNAGKREQKAAHLKKATEHMQDAGKKR